MAPEAAESADALPSVHERAREGAIEDLCYSRHDKPRLSKHELIYWEAEGGMQRLCDRLRAEGGADRRGRR